MDDIPQFCIHCRALSAQEVQPPSLTKIAHLGAHIVYTCNICGSTWCLDLSNGWDALHQDEDFKELATEL